MRFTTYHPAKERKMLRVEHRTDDLLKNSAIDVMEDYLKGTHIEKVTIPHHTWLFRFLNEMVIDNVFEDEKALKETLALWANYAALNGLELNKDWKELWITGEGENRGIAAAFGLGGSFMIASINELASEKEAVAQ
jgi:hypothetical protein